MKYTLTLLFYLFLATTLTAQQPAFRQFGIQDGLPSEKVYYAFQDKTGHLWFGTDRGVSRYDGFEFNNFTKANGLSDNEVFQIHEDSQGQIWLLTNKGIPTLYKNGVFSDYNQELEGILPGGINYCFLESSTGRYLFGNNNGILSLDQYKQNKPVAIPLPNTRVFHIWEAPDQQIYALTNIGFIKIFPDLTNTFQEQVPGNLSFSKGKTDLNGNLLFSNKEGLFSYLPDTLPSLILPSPANEIISINIIDSQLWLGKRKGVFQYDRQSTFWQLRDSFLLDKSITSVEKDFEGGYWFSTMSQGVFYTSKLNVKHEIDIGVCKDCHISFIREDSQRNLWIGGHDGFLMKQSDSTAETWKVVYPEHNRSGIEINEIFFINNETWLGTNGPCVRAEPAQKPWYSRPGSVRSVIPDGQDHLFLASTTGLWHLPVHELDINFLNEKGRDLDQFSAYRITDKRSTKVFRDKDDKIWLGTNAGLYFLKNQGLVPFKGEGFNPNTQINDIQEAAGFLVIATSGDGIYFLSEQNNYQLLKKDGLAGNFCKTITIDKAGDILIGTSNGISVLQIEKGQPKVLPFSDLGLTDVNAIFIKEEEVYAGTSHGLARFSKALLHPRKVQPKFYLNEIWVNNKIHPLPQILSHNQNQLQFKFKGVSFTGAKSIDYQYQFSGIHTHWKHSPNPEIEFASLAPGKYSLKARACYKNSDQCSEVIHFSFTIKKPFWKTTWFIFLSLCLAGSVIYAFFKIRILTYNRDVVRELIQLINLRLKKEHFITVKDISDGSKAKIAMHEIRWIESNRNYITVYTKEKEVTSRAPLKEIEGLLEQHKHNPCIRIHRSFIVNKSYIDAWHSTFVKIGDKNIPIGPNYKNKLEMILN